MNTQPVDVVSLAHAAKNKRTREEAQLEQFDNEDMSPTELAEEEASQYEFPDILPTPDEEKKRRVLTFQLKEHKIKHPNIDTRKSEAIDRELSLLSTEELENRLENVQIELGIANPGKNAKSALSLLGFILEYYLGLVGIANALLNDSEMVGCVDAYLPASFHWLGVPFLFCARLGGHVSNHINGNHRSNTPTILPSSIPAQQGFPASQAPAQPTNPSPNPATTPNPNPNQPPPQQQPPPPVVRGLDGTIHSSQPNHGGTSHPTTQGPANGGRAVPNVQPTQ
jgi:hypothetical protein